MDLYFVALVIVIYEAAKGIANLISAWLVAHQQMKADREHTSQDWRIH
jgi:hypothetical protein